MEFIECKQKALKLGYSPKLSFLQFVRRELTREGRIKEKYVQELLSPLIDQPFFVQAVTIFKNKDCKFSIAEHMSNRCTPENLIINYHNFTIQNHPMIKLLNLQYELTIKNHKLTDPFQERKIEILDQYYTITHDIKICLSDTLATTMDLPIKYIKIHFDDYGLEFNVHTDRTAILPLYLCLNMIQIVLNINNLEMEIERLTLLSM